MRYEFETVVSHGWHCVVYEEALNKLEGICDTTIELSGKQWKALKVGKYFDGEESEVYIVVDYSERIIGIVEIEKGGDER